MRVALLADIHGNADALDAILAAARRRGAERLLCAGDLVGYYYEPARCFDLLDEWRMDAVRGNHENMLQELEADPSREALFTARFGSGLACARQQLNEIRRCFLRQLPATRDLELCGRSILLCHGSPWDTDEYIYPESPQATFTRCGEAAAHFVVMGHSHCQMARRVGDTLVVNPGSVGQPRRGTGDAEWALLDLESGACELLLESYDRAKVAARARATDPHFAFLADIVDRP